MALTLASCGHQVTPDRTTGVNGIPSGTMQIRFTTAGPPDFTNNLYILAFNITGGGMPYAPNGNQLMNWVNFDFEVVVQNINGVPTPQMFQFVSHNGVGGGTIKQPFGPLQATPQQLFVTVGASCNGDPNSFCLNISRELFVGSSPGTATPSTSPSASPSPSPTASASPSPGPSVTGLPSGVWFVNWFVASTSSQNGPPGQVVDAPGIGGVTDKTFTFTVDTTSALSCTGTNTTSACTWNAPGAGWPSAPSAASQIVGGAVFNSP